MSLYKLFTIRNLFFTESMFIMHVSFVLTNEFSLLYSNSFNGRQCSHTIGAHD